MLHTPQVALLASASFYPSLLHLLSGPSPTPQRLASSTRTISTLHSTLTTLLALYILKYLPTVPSSPASFSRNDSSYPDDSQNPLITHRSSAANTATAIETGYLLSIIPSLLAEARLHGRHPSKTILAHHAGIGSALLALQYYILRRKERGIYIITTLLLMNASTPLLNLKWYVKTFHPQKAALRRAVDVALALAFLGARVLLMPAVVAVYGRVHGMGLVETCYRGLRWHCSLGMNAVWLGNLAWWVALVREMGGWRGGRERRGFKGEILGSEKTI